MCVLLLSTEVEWFLHSYLDLTMSFCLTSGTLASVTQASM
jgi:hypothetical protein